jgi:hypothetical protein
MAARRRLLASVPLAAALLLEGCSPSHHGVPWSDVSEVTPPFLVRASASDPSLAIEPGGRVALTWVTREGSGADAWVAVSADSGAHWSAPVRLESRAGMVSSYAESRPVVAWGRDGLLVAAWASARDTSHRADDIAVRISADGGHTWGSSRLVNDDHTDDRSTYHGFLALDVLPDGRPMVAWIDGRFSAAPGEEPAIADLFATTTRDGGETWSDNVYVAEGVCPCCRVSLRADQRAGGPVEVAVAFRGAVDDLRDPRLAISHDGGTTFTYDTLMSVDRWKLSGCPSIGPTLTFDDGGGHYAWFTGEASDSTLTGRPAPGAYLVPWRLGTGPSGAKRSLGDSLGDASRPMVASLGRGTLVAAIGRAVGGPARKVLAVRRLEPDGELTPWLYLGSAVRSAAIAGQGANSAWAAWTEKTEDVTRVRVAKLSGR